MLIGSRVNALVKGKRSVHDPDGYGPKDACMADIKALIGSWRMDTWTRTSVATGETTDALGPSPIGYIAYHPCGRMMASVFRRDRFPPKARAWTVEEKATLFDDMLAYVASYRLEENRVIHEVDGSWNPNWQGVLDRPFNLDGNRLFINGAPGIDPATGEEVIYSMEFTKDCAEEAP
ncbi:lipocalin-like domain-containing protein [Roseovarius tibetensis]|uniref:lipocalin-like domain-containing protein n=1 Tax=Roseovarius tibetensis TaxID=2685897 RepID=UPI003D7F86F2